MACAGTTPPSWADLPEDLTRMVLCRLPAFVDHVRFAAVCPQWRAAARQHPVPRPMPLLALPDGTFYSLPDGKPFRFPDSGYAGYKNATADGSWLVFPRDDGCFLVDPLAGPTKTLPPLSSIPPSSQRSSYMPVLNKLIFCSPNLVAAFAGSTMVQCGHNSQILVCQPGASSWSVRANDKCKLFEDMAFYQGQLYALADDENLLIVNISQDPITGDPQVSQIGQVITAGDPFHTGTNTMVKKKLYLVESHGALLMARRKVFCRMAAGERVVAELEQTEFEVFAADLEHSQWVHVKTLGDDQMLFLGRPCSRAVSASQHGMQRDQIFFLDDVMENAFQGYAFEEENTCVGVYDMGTGKVSSPLPMVWKDDMILATWLFPWE
ncbi:unnamed protein product [Alopecurus aequalis]